MTTVPHGPVLVALVVLLSACASFPKNPPLPAYEPTAGYRFENLEQGENSDKLFVIVTFSGGGTRAAAIAYGVLEGLRDSSIQWQGRQKALLDEVDIISSISGGSFTAAYYGLRGRATFDEFREKFLYRPVQSELVEQLFSPVNLWKLAGSSYGRSDLAAEFYDREIFDGATYADLIARHRRPFVVLNATDMSIGAQFPFIQDQFDLICSDLSGIPVGRAAAASSAFPGLLTPLTFENFAGTCGYEQASWVALAIKDWKMRTNPRRTAGAVNRVSYTQEGEARRDFLHLPDGGVADNIGLRGPLGALTSVDSPWSVLRLANQRKIDRLVVIIVNAATEPATRRDKTPEVPGVRDTLETVSSVPLDSYSFDTLELLRATVREYNEPFRVRQGCLKRAAAARPPCIPEIPLPHHIDFYNVQVAFDNLRDPEQRAWFKNLPTTFELPRETIDKLTDAGRCLLHEDPEFKRLVADLGGRIQETGEVCAANR